ncbi:MAG: M20/M25/M40 family metallo-hydrolase [Armatimonadetes bacterium]|nr:M20/M25/M40 family metallo-hydrolase [Armatimonadota bacterium]
MSVMTPARRAAVVELLADLVRLPSVNQSPEQANRDRAEALVADYVETVLGELGMTVERREVAPGRPNLIGRWDGPAGLPPLTLEAHMDTVGVDEMTVPPFAAEIRGEVMVGRGTCDTKGSLAAFLMALRVAREEGWRFERPVQMVAAMGEETGCEGALALVAEGAELGWVVVGEPTSCEVVVAHKGALWLEVLAHGRSAHGSVPSAGRNAISLMARVLACLEEHWIPSLAAGRHELLGSPTVNVGLIEGGEKVNVVPARCRIELDHRVLPGNSAAEVLAELRGVLRAGLGDEAEMVEVRAIKPMFPGFALDPEAPLASRMLAAVRATGTSAEPRGVSYFSDAGPFAAAGWPTVVFGPGDIRQAHGPEEFVPLAELSRAVDVVVGLLATLRRDVRE